jgi:hypothetical protein
MPPLPHMSSWHSAYLIEYRYSCLCSMPLFTTGVCKCVDICSKLCFNSNDIILFEQFITALLDRKQTTTESL